MKKILLGIFLDFPSSKVFNPPPTSVAFDISSPPQNVCFHSHKPLRKSRSLLPSRLLLTTLQRSIITKKICLEQIITSTWNKDVWKLSQSNSTYNTNYDQTLRGQKAPSSQRRVQQSNYPSAICADTVRLRINMPRKARARFHRRPRGEARCWNEPSLLKAGRSSNSLSCVRPTLAALDEGVVCKRNDIIVGGGLLQPGVTQEVFKGRPLCGVNRQALSDEILHFWTRQTQR